ncbi:hypothetical protein B566_EDAN017112, partial [Ephemera danica]
MENCRTCRQTKQNTGSSLQDPVLTEWIKSNLKIKILDSAKICLACIDEIKRWTSFNKKIQHISHSNILNENSTENGNIEPQIS